MTVTYSLEVSRSRLCGFLKLLFRWKGSIYKLMYGEMLLFTACYYAIAVVYRCALPDYCQRVFEKISFYCREFTDLVPITFVLGFYVALIVGRWWEQYMAIPWIDRAALQVAAYLQGADEKGRMMRRALVRYLNLIMTLTFQATSTVVKKRFPTLDHLEEAGLLTNEERITLEEANAPHGYWWIPTTWFANLAMEARKEGRIHDDLHLKSIVDEMMNFRGGCGMAWSYDWISVPLVYTQVVAISVYCFFGACLLGRQYLYQIPPGYSQKPSSDVDFYVPIFTLFQFFFYMGWLKVAEEMICPYGEDDDDFELNWVIDRNVQVGYLIVDDMYSTHPSLTRDLFWDETVPELPYTAAAAGYRREPYLGSTVDMAIGEKEMEWHIETIPEDAEVHPTLSTDVEKGAEAAKPQKNSSESPPCSERESFLDRLKKGTSRLSLHMSEKNSENPYRRRFSVDRGGVRSPAFQRQRSAMSNRSQYLRSLRLKRNSAESDPPDSRPQSVSHKDSSWDSEGTSDQESIFKNSGSSFSRQNSTQKTEPTVSLAEEADSGSGTVNPFLPEQSEPQASESSSYLDFVNVPPILTEVPEPEEEESVPNTLNGEYAPLPKTEEEKLIEDAGTPLLMKHFETKEGEEEEEGSGSTNTEQKTVTSLIELLKKTKK